MTRAGTFILHGVALLACLLLHVPARAWCPVGFSGPGNADDYYAFEVENHAQGWIDTVDAPTLNTTTTSPLYWRDVMLHVVDTATQTWSRNGRARVKIGYRGVITNPPAEPRGDGHSVVYTDPCPSDPHAPAAYAWVEYLLKPGNCDIVVHRGSCTTLRLGTASDLTGADASNFARIVRHEMGHCMGLEHASADSDCTAWRCFEDDGNRCTPGQLVCPSTCRITEHPLLDDTIGHHAENYGGGPPRREVVFGMATVSAANAFADAETLNLIGGSVFPARIDCRRGTSTPDCVLARSYNMNTLKLDRITFAATSPLTFSDVGTTTVTFSGMTRSPDVAMGDTGVSVVVGYRSVGASLIGVEALRFQTSTGTFLSSDQLSTGDADITTHEARVVFVRGLGGTGRFVEALPAHDRSLKFFVSSDATGAAPWMLMAPNNPWPIDRVFDSFDFHCPRHQTPGSGDASCAVVVSSDDGDVQNGGAQTCQLAFTTTNVTASQCREPFSAMKLSTPVALVDYGSGTPSTQRTVTSWLMSLSRHSPDVSGGNSHLLVYGNDRTFPDSAIAVQDEYDLDFLGCSSFGLGDDAQSYLGGTSVDYCEFCDRIVRVGMGNLLTDPVGNKCF